MPLMGGYAGNATKALPSVTGAGGDIRNWPAMAQNYHKSTSRNCLPIRHNITYKLCVANRVLHNICPTERRVFGVHLPTPSATNNVITTNDVHISMFVTPSSVFLNFFRTKNKNSSQPRVSPLRKSFSILRMYSANCKSLRRTPSSLIAPRTVIPNGNHQINGFTSLGSLEKSQL